MELKSSILSFLVAAAIMLWGVINMKSMEMTPEDSGLMTKHFNDTNGHADGCGIHDGEEPKWVPYTPNDWEYQDTIYQCAQKIYAKKFGKENYYMNEFRKSFPLSKLNCSIQPSVSDLLTYYDNLYMIGDSVMKQQYSTLLCMINSLSLPGFREVNGIRRPTIKIKRNSSKYSRNTTFKMEYIAWGKNFQEPHQTWPLYHTFPNLLKYGSHRDIIIINAGHHYRSPDAQALMNHTSTITQSLRNARYKIQQEGSQRTLPHVFFMEADEENYPTSNGMYPGRGVCDQENCTCKAITKEMELGHADPDSSINWTSVYKRFSPDYSILNGTNASSMQSLQKNSTSCIPDCFPAFWRSALSFPILTGKKTSERSIPSPTEINVVPIWRQLIRRGIPSSRIPSYDCTHKGIDVVIEMNRQLLRIVRKVHDHIS
jgi:hypothetical protein